MSNTLINNGVVIIGNSSMAKNNATVVVGTARGGTSMVAGAMAKLGVYMGDKARAPVFEDTHLSERFEKNDILGVKSIVKEYSKVHKDWGWKRPSSIDRLNEVFESIGDARYIFIYKDVMSIANRNSISMLSDVLPGMHRALEQYAKTLEFLRSRPLYAMLVSYEKAMRDPTNFVSELIAFLNIEPTNEQVQRAIAFIAPNPVDYLDASRITKAEGRLGGITGRKVYGWARLVHSKKYATVEIYINDIKVGLTEANIPYQDLFEKYGQNCGYEYEMPLDLSIFDGDMIRARVANEIRDLENSGLEVKMNKVA